MLSMIVFSALVRKQGQGRRFQECWRVDSCGETRCGMSSRSCFAQRPFCSNTSTMAAISHIWS